MGGGAAAGNRRHSILVPSLAAGVALVVLISLGLWQLDRKAWKEELIATLEHRLSASPVALPPSAGAASNPVARTVITFLASFACTVASALPA